ncbi:ribonuclease D [Pseudoalteromonas fenneropenaei]|uniref:Ribonuclease D n=1 Tax=Pseudoalteromonas fenneropenaei TaxID=1737459 RepID=A0ABV7CIU3_9GAMM
MQYQFIATQSALDNFVDVIRHATVLAIDTEFMRRKTLYPEVALIQVYDGSALALIDPLAALDFDGLFRLFQDPDIVKVIHSPSEDIEVFQRFAGFVPAPLYDTQFALQLLGSGNCVGFASMVGQLLNIEIDKSESRTNWLQRPLTKEQLDYAASDVFHLLPCYQLIAPQIAAKGWQQIVFSESQLIAHKRAERVPDPFLYEEIKNAWQCRPRDLAVLRELAAWRQNKAEQKNLALSHVLKEHNMVEIAKRRPTSIASLRNIPGVEAMEVNRYGKDILVCIEKGKAVPDEACPAKLKRLIDFPEYKKNLKQIKHAVDKVAEQTGIPTDVLASKKQMNQVLSWCWKMTPEQQDVYVKPDLFLPWRRELVAAALKEWMV